MRKQTSRRNALALGMTVAMFTLGLLVSVFVAGSASASGPLPSSTTDSTTTPAFTPDSSGGFDANSPQAQFLVINGSVNATSDHEIVGSSAFPNYTTGAVDNYYSMSRSHLDNSPFSEGTASPADTGPIGQTAAAGNFQQPQYADARWPGGPDRAEYGTPGQPFAEAGAFEAAATADASEASNGLSGPGLDGSKTLAVPKGFDNALTKVLAGWKTKYLNCPAPPKKAPLPSIPAPKVPKVNVPKPKAPAVTTPTVTTPLGKVSVPTTASAPSVPAPTAPAIPTAPAAGATRSLSAVPSLCASASGSESDGEHALKSSTLGVLVPGDAAKNSDIDKVDARKLETTPTATTTDATTTQATTTPGAWKPKPYTMLLGGESSMGRVVLGHGQIVIDGIHVTASVANDGSATPAYKANVSVASASIGGVPVTIDQNGVHVAGQGQGLPYKQASDGLNSALKQAGIQIFLVAPQVTNCGPSGGAPGTGTTTTTTTTTATASDQTGTSNACGDAGPACASGSGTGTDTTTTTTSTPTPTPSPTSTDQAGTSGAPPSSCPPPDSCSGTATDGATTTTTNGSNGAPAGLGGTTTTTTSTGQTDTTSTTSSWCSSTAPSTSSCAPASTAPSTSTTSTDQSGTAVPPPGTDPMAMGNSGQETIVSATGVHVVFTQPVSPSGVPAQFVEHILGEVSVDSLAAPATPLPGLGSLSGGLSSSPSSSCPGGKKSSTKALGSAGSASGSGNSGVAGSSTAAGSTLGGTSGSGSGSLSGSGSGIGSASGTNASSTGGSLPATIAAALRKPLWLLLAYLVWQALVIGTGASLWNWRREDQLP